MILALYGSIAMAAAVVSLIFLRYFTRGRDYFFLLFSIAFALEATANVLSIATSAFGDETTARYVLRLLQYLVILSAIIQKNLARPNSSRPD